jgi:arabinose-5-phosphate isomerase
MTNKNYFQEVVKLLRFEAKAIIKVTKLLDPCQVEKALNLMNDCQGKIILLGIGKSGIVARKISSTLNSIGVVAVFIHPVEALHGDIGIINSKDIVIALSNSGETEELLAVLPYLKHRQTSIIAIVGNINSTLARSADVVIAAVVEKEACPLNLVPTASSTIALAIGDALAMTLMQIKGLTSQDFAFNHPAGSLGKRLVLRVADLMYSGVDNPVISPQANWIEIISQMSRNGLGAVNVIDGQERLLGIITDGDLRRSFENIKATKLEQMRADEIMTSNPITVDSDLLAYEALQIMENRSSQISVLPVVNCEQRCLGLLRLHDIVRSGLSQRFPGKPLAMIDNRPMIQWVYEAVLSCSMFSHLVVATDSGKIADCVRKFGGNVEMTHSNHLSGTDRVAEVAQRYSDMDIVVNIQGDQPFVSKDDIFELVSPYLKGETPEMTTLGCPLSEETDYQDPNIVKVLCTLSGQALYFSRASIPYFRNSIDVPVFHHLGLYAFRRDFLLNYAKLTPTPLEKCENLEQLRVLEHGYSIKVCTIQKPILEINTPADLEQAKLLITQGIIS